LIKMAKKDSKNKIVYTSFLELGTEICELVGDNKEKMFCKWDILKESSSMLEKVDLGDIVYLPPVDDLVSKGTVLLPTAPQEYGDMASLLKLVDKFIYKYLDIPDPFRRVASFNVSV